MGEQDQQTRQRLLRCAKAEFLSRGFEHASLRRICEAAGVTTGAVYFFFQNKEDLFAQIVQDTAQQLPQLGRRRPCSCWKGPRGRDMRPFERNCMTRCGPPFPCFFTGTAHRMRMRN